MSTEAAEKHEAGAAGVAPSQALAAAVFGALPRGWDEGSDASNDAEVAQACAAGEALAADAAMPPADASEEGEAATAAAAAETAAAAADAAADAAAAAEQ